MGSKAAVLAGSFEQASKVHSYLQMFWQSETAPVHELLSDPTARLTKFRNGGRCNILTASAKSARSGHPNRLRVDEADEIPLPIYDAATGQTMRDDIESVIRRLDRQEVAAQTNISSTHQHPAGTMTELKTRMAERGQPIYRWCWRESLQPHGWLTQEEVDRKKTEVSDYMWQSEYEGVEPSAGDLAIMRERVELFFDSRLGEFSGDAKNYIEIEPPQKAARYSTGIDWAQRRDWTIITTLRVDCHPWKLVAWERRGRESWPIMIERAKERKRRFGGTLWHDETGIGTVIHDYLEELGTCPTDGCDGKNCGYEVHGFQFVGNDRKTLLGEAIVAVEQGDITSPIIRHLQGEMKWMLNSNVYGPGHLPDGFSSLALAIRAAKLSKPAYWPYDAPSPRTRRLQEF